MVTIGASTGNLAKNVINGIGAAASVIPTPWGAAAGGVASLLDAFGFLDEDQAPITVDLTSLFNKF
jgi:hypothetical protein